MGIGGWFRGHRGKDRDDQGVTVELTPIGGPPELDFLFIEVPVEILTAIDGWKWLSLVGLTVIAVSAFGTNWRYSWQIGQPAGGSELSLNWVPHVMHINHVILKSSSACLTVCGHRLCRAPLDLFAILRRVHKLYSVINLSEPKGSCRLREVSSPLHR